MTDIQKRRLVILDRDGVINEDSDAYIKSTEEWNPIPGSIEAIGRLSRAGFRIAVATNQSGLARGLYDLDTLHAMHDKMLRLVDAAGGVIECIVYCPHGPDDGCECRKPRPGLVRQIEVQTGMPASRAWFVGDSLKDLQVARATGALPILVRTGKGVRTESAGRELEGVPVFDDLASATEYILESAG